MKWLAIIFPLCLLACAEEQKKNQFNWAQAAESWAQELGETSPKVSFNPWWDKEGATCAVKMNNVFYKVYCYRTQKCELAGGK